MNEWNVNHFHNHNKSSIKIVHFRVYWSCLIYNSIPFYGIGWNRLWNFIFNEIELLTLSLLLFGIETRNQSPIAVAWELIETSSPWILVACVKPNNKHETNKIIITYYILIHRYTARYLVGLSMWCYCFWHCVWYRLNLHIHR